MPPPDPAAPPGRGPPDEVAAEAGQIRRLEAASLVEGTTLLLLVLVAVPLKHALHVSAAVTVMGPVHGLAFLFYVWCAVEAAAGGGWSRREIARLFVAALVPFAGLTNLAVLRNRAAAAAGRA